MKTELMKLDYYITFCLRLKNQADNSDSGTNI